MLVVNVIVVYLGVCANVTLAAQTRSPLTPIYTYTYTYSIHYISIHTSIEYI